MSIQCVSVSVSVSMSGPCPSVSNRVCFRVLAHVSDCVDQCPCSCGNVNVRYRVRVRVRDIIRYLLPVYVVVAVTFSARSWDLDHEFERVTVPRVRSLWMCQCITTPVCVCVSVSMCVSLFVSVSLSIVVPVFMAMSLSVVVSEAVLPVETCPCLCSQFMFVTVFVIFWVFFFLTIIY